MTVPEPLGGSADPALALDPPRAGYQASSATPSGSIVAFNEPAIRTKLGTLLIDSERWSGSSRLTFKFCSLAACRSSRKCHVRMAVSLEM